MLFDYLESPGYNHLAGRLESFFKAIGVRFQPHGGETFAFKRVNGSNPEVIKASKSKLDTLRASQHMARSVRFGGSDKTGPSPSQSLMPSINTSFAMRELHQPYGRILCYTGDSSAFGALFPA